MDDRPRSMSGRILEGQLRWARRAGLDVDASASVADPAEHLMVALSEQSRRELEASAFELLGEHGKRGSLHGLDSSHALLFHLVEPLRAAGVSALDVALGGRGDGGSMRLCASIAESQDEPPVAEAELVIESSHPTLVLARYREPYASPDRRRPTDPDAAAEAWSDLPGCRSLARDLRANPDRYARLEVGRILEVIRLLTRRYGARGFRLVNLWFDGPGPESRQFAREFDRLRMRVGGDVEIDAIGWRCLFDRLRAAGAYADGYAESLLDRYFAAD